jgi:hypothetical protein
MPVRWLLADEVGLGKTIEAALIMNRLGSMRPRISSFIAIPTGPSSDRRFSPASRATSTP